MYTLYLLVVTIARSVAEDGEQDTLISGIVTDIGTLAAILAAVGLLLVGLCVFVAIMWYQRGANSDNDIGPITVTQI